MNKTKSIRTQIILFYAFILIITLIFQIVINLYTSKNVFIKEKSNQIESLFSDIKSNYSENDEKLSNILNKATESYNIKVIIADRKKIIYTNEVYPQVHNIDPRFLGGVEFRENPKAKLSINDKNDTGLISLSGYFIYNNEYRYVLLESRLEPINNSIKIFSKISIIVSLVVLLFALIGGYIFATKIVNPIKDIQNIAENVSDLNFSLLASENKDITELYSLSKSINKMAKRLESTILQLKNDINVKEKTENMRKEFIANVSHEMKTPLTLLIMYSETLKDDIDGIDKDYYLQTIMDEAYRLDLMVKSLLDISSIENGFTKVKLEDCNLSQLCNYILSKFSIIFNDYDIDIDIQDYIFVKCDGYFIEQAIKNYILNAVSHTELNKKIKISLRKHENNAVLEVFNQGSNIPSDELDLIWQSFYRIDKSRVRNEENNFGLGLYIVKTIIEKHDGICDVYNKEDGVIFNFSIPII